MTIKINLKVLGHIIGDGTNRDKPQVSKRKTFVLSARVQERETVVSAAVATGLKGSKVKT